jgi:hypothetical protein
MKWRINKQNWKQVIIELLMGLFSLAFGSTLVAWMADSYGILHKTDFTMIQEVLFLAVWGFCVLGVTAVTSYLVGHLTKSRVDNKEK